MGGSLSPIKRRICNKIQRMRALCRERDGILSGVEILIAANSQCGALRHRTSASKKEFYEKKEGGLSPILSSLRHISDWMRVRAWSNFGVLMGGANNSDERLSFLIFVR
jgi:hypothetical protein